MTQPLITRRTILASAAVLPLAGAAIPTHAAAPMLGASATPYTRFKLGAFEVTTLLAATRAVPDPHKIFGMNVSEAEFASVSQIANIPTDMAQFFFTPTVVNTGNELILFDTGLNADGVTTALTAAGYTTDQIDVVVITHMHPDHIGGLMEGTTPTFANARYITGAKEFDAWSGAGNGTFESKMLPLAEKTTMLNPEDSIAPGITAVDAFGHTPGHMGYMLESNGQLLLLGADFANHYIWSLAHPDWEVKYDQDKAAAAATRRRLLGMLAADKVPFIGYHMPWPALGYVETRDDGFRYVPASYQLML